MCSDSMCTRSYRPRDRGLPVFHRSYQVIEVNRLRCRVALDQGDVLGANTPVRSTPSTSRGLASGVRLSPDRFGARPSCKLDFHERVIRACGNRGRGRGGGGMG